MSAAFPSASFKFQAIPSPIFGTIYRPVADVLLWSAKTNSWKKVQMVVDSGADYTILPRYLAVWLELDLAAQGKLIKTVGVGGLQEVYLVDQLKVRVGKFERQIPVGFVASTTVPPLMGRQGFLDSFETTLSFNQKTTFAAQS